MPRDDNLCQYGRMRGDGGKEGVALILLAYWGRRRWKGEERNQLRWGMGPPHSILPRFHTKKKEEKKVSFVSFPHQKMGIVSRPLSLSLFISFSFSSCAASFLPLSFGSFHRDLWAR